MESSCVRQTIALELLAWKNGNLLPFLINHIPPPLSLLPRKNRAVSLVRKTLQNHFMFYPLVASLGSSLEVTGPDLPPKAVEAPMPKRF